MSPAEPAASSTSSSPGHLPTQGDLHCDLLVIGSGAGALGAAVTAAHLGLRVVVVEKEYHFGGTTAWSGGWMWVPRNPLARAAGITEGIDGPRAYLRHILGPRYDQRRVEAFLAHAPAMVQFHLDHTALKFVDGNAVPDFHGNTPGARTGGRSVCAAPFDAARLGPALLKQLKPPRDIYAFLGMSIGGDLRHFMRANRALDSFVYVVRRIVKHGIDLLTRGQGRQRMGGNALVAALLATAREQGVTLLAGHAARELLNDGDEHSSSPGHRPGRVTGAVVDTPAGPRRILASRGVVLACGGFPHDVARKSQLFAHAPTGHEHWSAAPPSNTGDGLRLAELVGAQVDTNLADTGAWAPVSLVPRPGGGVAAFAHLAERGKPGLIAVDASGRRFADEAGNYHSFMRGLFARAAQQPGPGKPIRAWLICDHRFQRRYGLGHSKPWPFPLGPWLTSGYLQRADSLAGLARRCGIAEGNFVATMAAYNHHAELGQDPEFGRGSIPYDRMQGDAEHTGPNPCVAPIVQGPYYAVAIVPGSLGTFAGLAVDEHARVLGAQGEPIQGLYAAGNDMASVMAGEYPSGGITLGPALTFGYVLAHHAAGRPLPMPTSTPTDDN